MVRNLKVPTTNGFPVCGGANNDDCAPSMPRMLAPSANDASASQPNTGFAQPKIGAASTDTRLALAIRSILIDDRKVVAAPVQDATMVPVTVSPRLRPSSE